MVIGPMLGLDTGREVVLGEREPFEDLLPREVDVDVVAKINRHDRQAEFRDRLDTRTRPESRS